MFRDLTKKKQKLSSVECKEIFKQEVRGVLAVNGDDGYPYALMYSLNHYHYEISMFYQVVALYTLD